MTLFSGDTIGDILSLPAGMPVAWARYLVSGLLRAVAEIEFGGQGPAEIAAARNWLDERSGWEGRQVLDALLHRVEPRIGVEKTPGTSTDPIHLARALRAYPEVRLIHLVRHPLTSIRSAVEHWSGVWTQEMDLRLFAAVNWQRTHSLICAIGSVVSHPRLIRVRAEDLLGDSPRVELSRIAEWLGIDHSDDNIEAMLHPERSPFAFYGPEEARGGADPKFLSDPRRRTQVAPPLKAMDSLELDAKTIRELQYLGAELGYQ